VLHSRGEDGEAPYGDASMCGGNVVDGYATMNFNGHD
jgi:hypothetical protein